MTTRFLLLQGIVGSQAYGMATPQSDIDFLGVFAYPTIDLTLLGKPKPSIVQKDPDSTIHEAGKFCSLALKCNPTILELLWLGSYTELSDLGYDLLEIRKHFLSAQAVRNAYFGYAYQQFDRIRSRGDNSFSADTRKRTAKHARHLLRLLEMGLSFYQTGDLTLKVPEVKRDAYFSFGEEVAAGNLWLAQSHLESARDAFDKGPCALPDQPDDDIVERWLKWVRRQYWNA